MSQPSSAEVPVAAAPVVIDDPRVAATALEVAAFSAAFAVLFKLFCHVFTSRFFLERFLLKEHDAKDIACKLVSAVFAVGAATSGIDILRYGGRSDEHHYLLRHAFNAAVAYFHYDLWAMFVVFSSKILHEEALQNKKQGREEATSPGGRSTLWSLVASYVSHKSLIVTHHVVIGSVLTPLMMARLDHDPGELLIACALVMEGSTPFVSFRAILSHLGMKKSALYLANGLAMVVAFLCCRVLVYPAFFASYADQRRISVAQALARPTPFCHAVLWAVLALQLYWFGVMVKGAVKVLEDSSAMSSTVAPSNNSNGHVNTNGSKKEH